MSKGLCIVGAVVAVLLLILFVLDLSIGFPFQTSSKTIDIGMTICAVALAYLSWATFREQT